jgi:acetoin utilization protein AcuB
MILEEIMKTNVFTLTPTDTLGDAVKLLTEHRIRHLPVVNESRQVIGIVSDRDIRDASPSIFHTNEPNNELGILVQSIMTKNVISGGPLDFVEEAAATFYEHKIGCLPIESNGKLVGIVTETDILYTLVQLTGANQPSSHIEIKVPNRTGLLAEVANIVKNRNINITSVLVYPDKDANYKILVFRVQTMNPTRLISDLEEKGFTINWPNNRGFSHG